ncbi:RDD family protein [Daejeonella oryzae]|uniref:RDD family protein n=1 Tax=Daejeonella oryzae TaxID=1122943 RepID=UPI0005661F10|nr:RDD family protein [Daejeonella oryzae]
MSLYYVVINGKPAGPYKEDELKNLKIMPGTFIKTSEMDDFKEAHEVPALRGLFGWNEIAVAPQYFASMDIRLLAVIIDYFILFGIYIILASVVIAFIDERDLRILISLSGLAIIPIVKIFYASYMEASARQGTFGKVLMSVKVCDENGSRITPGRSVIRNFSKILSVATLGIGYIIGFFDKRQQCLHDKIAGTLVRKERLI